MSTFIYNINSLTNITIKYHISKSGKLLNYLNVNSFSINLAGKVKVFEKKLVPIGGGRRGEGEGEAVVLINPSRLISNIGKSGSGLEIGQ